MWHALIDSTTRKPLSYSSAMPVPKSGQEVKIIRQQPDETHEWNPATETVIPRSPKAPPVDPLAATMAKTSSSWTLADIADMLKDMRTSRT